jgi:hypothetical protein
VRAAASARERRCYHRPRWLQYAAAPTDEAFQPGIFGAWIANHIMAATAAPMIIQFHRGRLFMAVSFLRRGARPNWLRMQP